ncbi:MAG: TIGR03364 family FAD-dependent oxidoreductase [Flavobacteriales bacterium]|nr:TIGR03364 family FAD-dependent oxidoreductase [Flavobacteriales bacterium]
MKTYDIICIGAGILGSMHAYHAALKGKKVLLIERDVKPYEGTVRNFGQVVPSGQALPTWREIGVESLNIYKSIQEKFDISIRNNGSTYLASNEIEMALLEEMHEVNKSMGYPSELLTRDACLSKFSLLQKSYCVGGLFYPQEVSAEPNHLIYRLIEFITKSLPIDFLNHHTVVGCEIKNEHCITSLANGEKIKSDKIIVCSGREFKILFPEIFQTSGLQISKLQMMLSRPMPEINLPGNILTGMTIRRYEGFHSLPSYSKLSYNDWELKLKEKGIHILFKQAIDGSIILGDSHEYADASNPECLDFGISLPINQMMIKEAQRIMNLPSWEIVNTWNGYYATHPNEIFTHDIEHRIHIITGIGGKGMTCSAGFSRRNIDRILQ